MPRLVLLSDTHGLHHRLRVPEGDVLVHAGDFCTSGKEIQARDFAKWFLAQPHPHKVVIAGNHDRCLELDLKLGAQIFNGATYLLDKEATVAGLRFYGSPWQPEFMSWSFNLARGEPLREVWAHIPVGVDVLITHGPPFGILDRTVSNQAVGCEELRKAIDRVRPRLHVFGHIHEGAGSHVEPGTLFVNASVCTEAYTPENPIFVVDLPLGAAACTVLSPTS
ncbi:MAG: metallophosphatase domain-containing protein [Polyangiaceae bacterium]|nr:metallophosphatase domain-containing protein [Polyangiaceae bacterium]